MKVVSTSNAPAAIGTYSQAIISGNHIYSSGKLPINPKSGKIEAADIQTQSEQAIKNLIAILESAGSSLDNVVKTTCFLKNITDFADFNEVYSKYFLSKPARSCFEVANLPMNALVEIEAIAELNN